MFPGVNVNLSDQDEERVSAIDELGYQTHIVLRLYETKRRQSIEESKSAEFSGKSKAGRILKRVN